MRGKKTISRMPMIAGLLCALSVVGMAQSTGSVKGRVTIEDKDLPVHNVIVLLTSLKRSTETDEQGIYEFRDVPAGSYNMVARFERMPDVVNMIEVKAGGVTEMNIKLRLSGVRDTVTISATGVEQTAAEAFQGVTGLDSTTLLETPTASLGEALEKQTGITKRGFGPASTRPVIRGFDGDRVLIAQDGMRTGSLSYSSGDHGEPINVLTLERIEVVRGPATLLYGSSAIGGLINAVSGHEKVHEGVHGFISGVGSTTVNSGGGSTGIEFGKKNYQLWANGGAQRADDYNTPIGKILNSGSRNYDFTGGGGYYTDRGFFSGSYTRNYTRFGIPSDPAEEDPEIAELNPRRHNVRLNAGINDLSSALDHLHMTFDYTDYKHEESVGGEPESKFFNKTLSYRVVADQKRAGIWSGSFGISGFRRDFKVDGEEALAPPTIQNSFAAFGLQTLEMGRVAFQLGGRVEHNAYDTEESADIRNRSFTGFSGSAGVRVPLWEGGAFSANYTHSYRAPSLDELYNNGPHPGNLTFEIGNTNLIRERGDGVDLSLRHSSSRVRGEFHYFYYALRDFVFLAPTGEEEDGLPVADYRQGDSRFMGTELDFGVGLRPNLWLNASLDYVNAELTASNTPLPRIPPLRTRLGFDWQYKGLRLVPEVVLVRDQDRFFTNETRTPGYGLVNLLGSYTFIQPHAAHIFSVNAFNLNDKLYFNHLSFIKNFAPEVGRGVRFTYTVRFF
jgi:iron complex outermembrane receptor protein